MDVFFCMFVYAPHESSAYEKSEEWGGVPGTGVTDCG